MIRRLSAWFSFSLAAAFAVSAIAAPPAPAPPGKTGGKPAANAGPTKQPTTVPTLAMMMEGFKWGAAPDEVVKLHNQVQGVFDKEYNDELIGMQPGIKMQEKMAERENAKIAFIALKKFEASAHIVYGGLEGEYTHGNKESAHIREGLKGRRGDRRFFFYIGDRLWKIYDVLTLGPGGSASFQEHLAKIQAKVGGAAGTQIPAAPDRGLPTAFLGWADATTQLRLIDKSDEKKVVQVLEDKATLSALPQLRSRKDVDPTAELGADVAAATKGGLSDPSAKGADKTADKTPPGKTPPGKTPPGKGPQGKGQ